MKKIYDLKKDDLTKKEKEFKKTAYGKKLSEIKNSMLVEEVIFVFVMVISQIDSKGIDYIVQDSVIWLGLLIASGFTVLIQMKYMDALKEYINNSKEREK